MSGLDVNTVVAMLRHACVGMQAAKEELTHADQAIGDGDHGIGMYRGFEAVAKKLESPFESLSQLLNTVGATLLMSVGGSSGAIFGTLFMAGSKNIPPGATLDSFTFGLFLSEGLSAVKQRGGAKVGDKTLVDALEPAAQAATQAASEGKSLIACMTAAAQAAAEGSEKTKSMVATLGRAKTLGERALGHVDPGSVSMTILLKEMAAFAAKTV